MRVEQGTTSNRIRKKSPTPASPETVERALNSFSNSQEPSRETAARAFLDKIGLRNLENPEAAVALSSSACAAIRKTIDDSPELAIEVIKRITECSPTDEEVGSESIAYLWLAQCAGHAVAALPIENREVEDLIRQAASMRLNSTRYARGALRASLLTHPSCPPDILYQAAVSWPLEDALLVKSHPRASDEAKVALTLRS